MVAKLAQTTTHNTTQTQHNTPQHTITNMSRCHHPPVALPSLSNLRAAVPSNLSTVTPHESIASAWWRVHNRCGWFLCLGRQNATHQEKKRGVGPRAYVAAVQSLDTTTNQQTVLAVGRGFEKRSDWSGTCGGQCLLIVQAIKLNNKK